MRKFSTNPLQKHRAVTINNSCMYLKLLLRRYTERFFSKNREHKSRKKGKRKEKKKTEKNGKRQKWKRKIEYNSKSFRNKCYLRKASGKWIKICFHLQVKGGTFGFCLCFKIWFVTICLKYIYYSQLNHITYGRTILCNQMLPAHNHPFRLSKLVLKKGAYQN